MEASGYRRVYRLKKLVKMYNKLNENGNELEFGGDPVERAMSRER
jgi:hypothetical protein